MTRSLLLISLLFTPALLVACGSRPPSQPDAGVSADGGSLTDGGGADGGVDSDGGPSGDGGATVCEALASAFAREYPSLRACGADGDCVSRTGVCGSFLNECAYALSRGGAARFDQVYEALWNDGCAQQGLACVPCARSQAVCLAGECALRTACEYTCALDCECERDANGCDQPRCAMTPSCGSGGDCGVRSLDVGRACRPRGLVANTAGQLIAQVTSYDTTCRDSAAPCVARLESGTLYVDPFVHVDTRIGIDCVDSHPPPFTIGCTAPALAAGRYPVVVGGVSAGEIAVGRSGTSALDCFDAASPSPSTTCTNGPAAAAPVAMCRPARVAANTYATIETRVPCADCFALPGTCGVRVTDRVIRVNPVMRNCQCSTCGACAQVCRNLSLRCVLPPLAAGTYQLHLNGNVAPVEVRANASTELICQGT